MKTRNLIIICALVAVYLIASCKKNDENNVQSVVFSASIEDRSADIGRTTIDTTACNEVGEGDGVVIWSLGDQICLNNGTTTSTLGLMLGANSTEGTFMTHEEYFELTPPYIAAYPASAVLEIINTQPDPTATPPILPNRKIVFNLPKTQDLGNHSGTFANGANPMVAKSDNTELTFKNPCGGLGVRLKAGNEGIKVTNIRIISLNTDDKLWGSLEVTLNEDGTIVNQQGKVQCTITNNATDKHIINLNCNVSLSTTEAKRFFIILPEGTLSSGFTLEVTYNTTMNGCVAETFRKTTGTFTTTDNPEVVHNMLKSLPTFTLSKSSFSVSLSKKVYFSKGNLQWSATDTHEVSGRCSKVGTWRFATNQWDYVGDGTLGTVNEGGVKCNNASIAEDYLGWIDLLGWGTSEWYNGNLYYNPWDYEYSTEQSNKGFGYGPTNGTYYNFPLTNFYDDSDWGVYNAIKNGGNTPRLWRTLNNAEWDYVLNERKVIVGNDQKTPYGHGIVNNVRGLILLPDSWDGSADGSFTYGNSTWANSYTVDTWRIMEAAGAVFLPAAGYRSVEYVNDGNKVLNKIITVNQVGNNGYYWSATNSGTGKAYGVSITGNGVSSNTGFDRYLGYSVRLVKDVTP